MTLSADKLTTTTQDLTDYCPQLPELEATLRKPTTPHLLQKTLESYTFNNRLLPENQTTLTKIPVSKLASKYLFLEAEPWLISYTEKLPPEQKVKLYNYFKAEEYPKFKEDKFFLHTKKVKPKNLYEPYTLIATNEVVRSDYQRLVEDCLKRASVKKVLEKQKNNSGHMSYFLTMGVRSSLLLLNSTYALSLFNSFYPVLEPLVVNFEYGLYSDVTAIEWANFSLFVTSTESSLIGPKSAATWQPSPLLEDVSRLVEDLGPGGVVKLFSEIFLKTERTFTLEEWKDFVKVRERMNGAPLEWVLPLAGVNLK